MKGNFIIIVFLFFLNSAFAQEFEVHYTDTVAYSTPNSVFIIEGHITNLSSSNALTVKMVRVQNNLPSQNWTSSLCFGSCYPSWIDSITFDIPPDSSELYSVDFYADSVLGTASVLIKFATRNNSQEERHWYIGSTMPNAIDENKPNSITRFKLLNNYPNPFNNQTIISATVNKLSDVTLQIFDILGREIYTAQRNAVATGKVTFKWSGTNNFGEELSSGIYFYRINALSNGIENQSQIKKMTLLR